MSTWPIVIRYEGKPQGKGRPRFGKGRTYTPEKTKNYENDLKWIAKSAMRGLKPLQGPLKVSVHASFKAKKWSPHTSKPDLDNLVKCMDALNGIVWDDDAQIALLSASKVNGLIDFLEIRISPLTDMSE